MEKHRSCSCITRPSCSSLRSPLQGILRRPASHPRRILRHDPTRLVDVTRPLGQRSYSWTLNGNVHSTYMPIRLVDYTMEVAPRLYTQSNFLCW
ncbi:hypothetical protein M404DRAFT_544794 [Pisolithus tinctorius Marx 270]|uniref:Uncharacterized protein n=1 Tax=Pisolithus tinctorius Marx 270 TaxID=870435 RepID=A0A0C3J6F6_PISTI|nr:hypothetical protein M404DRAFT_544794 [Pisolithus tinctorius Marx 270]